MPGRRGLRGRSGVLLLVDAADRALVGYWPVSWNAMDSGDAARRAKSSARYVGRSPPCGSWP